jgi:hypothetical protein
MMLQQHSPAPLTEPFRDRCDARGDPRMRPTHFRPSLALPLLAAALLAPATADPAVAAPCVTDGTTLCLRDGRFEARVAWQDFQDGAGEGRPIPLTDDTGGFWFFRDTNLEVALKVLDGRTVNGYWWVFFGSLSNVAFTLTVRDTETGVERRYDNPARTFASRGDSRGFPELPAPALGAGERAATRRPDSTSVDAPPAGRPVPASIVPIAAPGTEGGWSRLGPDGGPVASLVASAGAPGVLFAASRDSGVFRSVDGGESWQEASGGLDHPFRREVGALAAVPGAPGHLYAGTRSGLYETVDGGGLWTRRGPARSASDTFEALAVDPAEPERLWAVVDEQLERSLDRGDSWQPVTALSAPAYGLTFDPHGAGAVYAWSDDGVHRSADGGDTWQLAVRGLHARDVTGLDVRPEVPGRLLAADGSGVYRSSDAGATWTRVLDGKAWHVASAADPATVYASGSPGVHRSRDGGLTWDPVFSAAGFAGEVWADPTDPDVAFVGVVSNLSSSPPPSTVERTLDGGETWEIVASTAASIFDLAIGPVAPDEPAILLFGNGIRQVHRSTDGGASFEQAAGEGLPASGTVVELAADPLLPGRFLASVFRDGLWETLDAGDTWRRYGTGLPAGTTLRLLVQRDDPTVVYAAADGLGAFRSADRGATWHPIGDGAAGAPTGRLPLGLSDDPLRLYAATDRGVWSIPAAPGTEPCVPGPATLCLQDGRFRVEVEWQDFEGGSGVGRSRPLADDSGAFWFFHDSNLELFFKVLDGRAVNGHWWVFYGSLSNVPFTLTVTDTETGRPRVYQNPPRAFASRGDTAAF